MAVTTKEKNALPAVGDIAPDFTLRDTQGRDVRLSDYRGKSNVVLYFYPKDFSGGCTAEACSFRDNYEVFKDAGAEVIGVSMDSEESHSGFAQKHRLPFVLLSDPDETAHHAYGVYRSFGGLVRGRVTFVIDNQGVVRYAFSSLNPMGHVEKALAVLRDIK
jgi:peroxiredoxin Q/BCP